MTTWKGYGLFVLVLTAMIAAVLFESLFLDKTLLSVDNRIFSPFFFHVKTGEPPRPMNIDSTDINGFIMPEALVSCSRWEAGELPLWNDRKVLGQPLHANMGFVSFYPTAPLYGLIDPLRAYSVALALHLLLLGLGTFCFFTGAGKPFASAFFGGTVVTFCGFLSVRYHLGCIIQTAAWYPWILIASKGLVDRPTLRRAAVLALLIGLCLLAGFPQIAMFILYASGAFFFVQWLKSSRSWKPLLLGFFAAVTGVLLSAVLLLPGLEYHLESTRSGKMTAAEIEPKCLEPVSSVSLILPHFFGDPVQVVDLKNPTPTSLELFPTYAFTTADNQNAFTENTFYLGCIPLALLAAALAGGLRRQDLFHLALVVVSVGMAFGVPLLVDGARLLPGISSGIPKRALWIASFSLVWLAASGIATIRASANRRSVLALFIAGIGFVVLGMLSWFPFERWVLPEGGPGDLTWFRETVSPNLQAAGLAGVVLLLSVWLVRRSVPGFAVVLLLTGAVVETAGFARITNPAQDRESQYASTPAIQWLLDHGAGRDRRIL
ncbi:MAG: hypothetical protein KJ645_14175, partial [Planctomycetes bacterium]|nr:hypothetical protein [Planctomycetota bacterium]